LIKDTLQIQGVGLKQVATIQVSSHIVVHLSTANHIALVK